MLLKSLLSAAARSGARARLSTLIFHRVLPSRDPLFPDEVDAAQFDAICRWVKDWFNVLPLEDAAARLAQGSLPARAMAITFDDGYADNLTEATPILRRHGLPCTFFIATGYLDGGRMWNDTVIESVRACRLATLDLRGLHQGLQAYALPDAAARRQAIDHVIRTAKYLPVDERLALVAAVAERAATLLPTDLMLTSDQLRALRAQGMQVGAHTVTHPILARLSRDAAHDEIEASKRQLEAVLGEPVRTFAYPNGKPGEDYSPRCVEVVREIGFAAAVSTQWGFSTRDTDVHQLRRFTPWDRTRLRFGLRLLRNLVA